VVYALSSYPVGVLADRVDRGTLLGLGVVVLVLSDLALGVALWGLHMGMTQGLLAALVADAAPANLRGTAYGLFNLVSGLALLAASVVAGGLWDAFGSRATFLAGAGFAIVALLALIPVARRVRRNRPAPG